MIFLLAAGPVFALTPFGGKIKKGFKPSKCPWAWVVQGATTAVTIYFTGGLSLLSGSLATGNWVLGVGKKGKCGFLNIVIAGASGALGGYLGGIGGGGTPPFLPGSSGGFSPISPKDFLKTKLY